MNEDLLGQINLKNIDELRQIAVQAENKFGDRGSWYTYFVRAIDGLKARIFGLREHYTRIQSISSTFPLSYDTIIELDHHLSDIFFNMDSAIECFVFGLNAIGYGIMDSKTFLSIENDRTLKQIGPDNIFKKTNNVNYQRFFPNLINYWLKDSEIKGYVTPEKLWNSIRDQHIVSKHRSRIYHQSMWADGKFDDIHLDKNPKSPLIAESEVEYDYYPWTLIDHLKEFVPFINKSCNLIIADLEDFINTFGNH